MNPDFHANMVVSGEATERFWLRVSQWFVEYPLDEAIHRLLGALARIHGADRAWVMRYDEGLSCLSNSHEWARDGVDGFVTEIQKFPVSAMRGLHAAMLRGEVKYFDVATMPDEMPELRAEFIRRGIQSVLCLPLFRAERLVGIWGYDAVRSRVVWSEEVIKCLQGASGVIAAALARSVSHRPLSDGLMTPTEVIFIAQAEGRFALPANKIVLIESQGDYTRVELDGSAPLLLLRRLATWTESLPTGRFLRVHRRYIVNVERIHGVVPATHGRWALMMEGRTSQVPVGRMHRQALRAWVKGGS
jgi:hypothetical protein